MRMGKQVGDKSSCNEKNGNVLEWKSFAKVKQTIPVNKGKQSKVVNRPTVIVRQDIPSDFIVDFGIELEKYFKHKFIAVWQAEQRLQLYHKLDGSVIQMEMDFAMNGACNHGDESKHSQSFLAKDSFRSSMS